MVENLLAFPGVTSSMTIAQSYSDMAQGATDNLYLLGHADGLTINEPYTVQDIGDAMVAMKSDSTSPLLRAMLEAYYAGARDIHLVAVAPMSEYVSNLTQRTQAQFWLSSGRNWDFYSQYGWRLSFAYSILLNCDSLDIVALIEAPFNTPNNIDFFTPLAQFVTDSFANSGDLSIGIMGTRGDWIPNAHALTYDNRIPSAIPPTYDSLNLYNQFNTYDQIPLNNQPSQDFFGEGFMGFDLFSGIGPSPSPPSLAVGKQVAVFLGDGSFNFSETPIYSASLSAAVAGTLASLPLNSSLVYRLLPSVYRMVYGDPTPATAELVTNAQLNVVQRNWQGKRGGSYQNVTMTDNTMGAIGTDFWALGHLRLVAHVMKAIRGLGRRYLGTIGFGSFKMDVSNFLSKIQTNQIIRNYSVDIRRSPTDLTGAIVNLTLTPFFDLRSISVSIDVGPQLT